MKQEKYGFIYVWYDKKRKMFYIGCHWGTVDDGYLCSSKRMRENYRYRPQDFKRRVVKKIDTNRLDLLEEEYRWLSMIDIKDLGKKYYNNSQKYFGHWSSDENKRLTVGQKISASPDRSANISKALKGKYVGVDNARYGIARTDEWKKWFSENHPKPNLGKTASDETRLKMSLASKGKPKSTEHVAKSAMSRTRTKRTDDQRKAMSDAQTGTKKPWAGGNNKGVKDSDQARENKRRASLLREQKKREQKLSTK
jgi:hypothetical protein